MDLDTFIVATYCVIDEELRELATQERWRARGPRPRLTDSEVLTMEVVGEYLGIDTDRGLYAYFRRHYGAWFPALRGCTARRSSAGPPTCGRSRSACGGGSPSGCHTSRTSR